MAFCSGAMAAIKKFWAGVTPILDAAATEIMAVTEKIKALEGDITVEAIIAAIPGGSTVEGWLNTGLGVITGVVTGVESFASAITTWLNGATLAVSLEHGDAAATAPVPLTKAARDMMVFKLASMAIKAADAAAGTQGDKTDSFYDSVVQLKAINPKL